MQYHVCKGKSFLWTVGKIYFCIFWLQRLTRIASEHCRSLRMELFDCNMLGTWWVHVYGERWEKCGVRVRQCGQLSPVHTGIFTVFYCDTFLLLVTHSLCGTVTCGAPCGLWGCKNWPAPFPGRTSYKATKPGVVSVLHLSMHYNYGIVVY